MSSIECRYVDSVDKRVDEKNRMKVFVLRAAVAVFTLWFCCVFLYP
jgi:fumarate reductase subunit C